MKAAIELVPVFAQGMSVVYQNCQNSSVYRAIYYNIGTIKYSMYALVVLLNLNVMVSGFVYSFR